MKHILTIDFDIVMKDSVFMYNNYSDMKWEERFKKAPMLTMLPMDGKIFYSLTKYLIYLFPKVPKEKIHFIYDHHQVVSFLSQHERYNIVNIDHHHDWYEGVNLDCGNWVKYIFETGGLYSYTWIKNTTSILPDNTHFHCLNIEDCDLSSYSEFDEIFLVLSPDFVPLNYHHMFFIWMDIASLIHQTKYVIE